MYQGISKTSSCLLIPLCIYLILVYHLIQLLLPSIGYLSHFVIG